MTHRQVKNLCQNSWQCDKIILIMQRRALWSKSLKNSIRITISIRISSPLPNSIWRMSCMRSLWRNFTKWLLAASTRKAPNTAQSWSKLFILKSWRSSTTKTRALNSCSRFGLTGERWSSSDRWKNLLRIGIFQATSSCIKSMQLQMRFTWSNCPSNVNPWCSRSNCQRAWPMV